MCRSSRQRVEMTSFILSSSVFFRWLLYFYLTIVFLWCVEQLCFKKDDVGRTIDIDIKLSCFVYSPSHEHHLLPPGEKVLVVVSEKETSSIIAYTLR